MLSFLINNVDDSGRRLSRLRSLACCSVWGVCVVVPRRSFLLPRGQTTATLARGRRLIRSKKHSRRSLRRCQSNQSRMWLGSKREFPRRSSIEANKSCTLTDRTFRRVMRALDAGSRTPPTESCQVGQGKRGGTT
jgi:hypothetical protein